ncbi:hypothetical protein [Gracilibacillus sp. Marseille-QA3620]
MSQKEKKWRKIYKYFMIFFYAILLPVAIADFFISGEVAYGILVAAIALPGIRANHLRSIREKEGNFIGQ